MSRGETENGEQGAEMGRDTENEEAFGRSSGKKNTLNLGSGTFFPVTNSYFIHLDREVRLQNNSWWHYRG